MPPNPPSFSWNTIPLFIHAGNQSGPLNETAAKYMSTFPIATLPQHQAGEQGYIVNCTNTSQICEEDAEILALKQIKSYNNNTRTLFYLNTFFNLPQYNLSTYFYGKNEQYLLHYHGNIVYKGDCNKNVNKAITIFDLSQNITRNLWLNTIKYVMNKYANVVDGIFADRGRAQLQIDFGCFNWTQKEINDWNQGHIMMIQETMRIVKEINPSRGIVIPNGADIDQINGRFYENFQMNDTYAVPPGNDLNNLINDNGIRISEAHKDKCNPLNGSFAYNQTLTVYLIGAYEYSYYACSFEFDLQNDWDITWQNKDYYKPLGAPINNATYDNKTKTYYREFTEGVQVFLDYEWKYPCIKWKDGSITGSKKDCQTYQKQ